MVVSVRRAHSHELGAEELRHLRCLVEEAFGEGFDEDDWAHALGGTHVLVQLDGDLLSHASVVPRTLRVGDRSFATGYVEAVATRPAHQRRGHATQAMAEVGRVIAERYELGALSTGVPALYARLGWEPWEGPTFVSTAGGLVRTAEDDGGVMVLRTPASERLDVRSPVACDWREGDVW